ncbi:MAG: DUF192 domain-containing protein [Patescibacteria group bacterium]
MKKLIAITIILVGIFSLWFYTRNPLQSSVTIRGTRFFVDLAITSQEKEIGLGNRLTLPSDHGMLFVYDHKEVFPFWMKNMRFPIDIIWIDNRTIVSISKNVPIPTAPTEQLPLYHPSVPVDKVLEVNAGLTDTYGISVGDKIIIKN